MDLDNLLGSSVGVETGKYFVQVVLQNMFEPVDTRRREKGADRVASLAVLIVVNSGKDRLRS